MQLIDNAQQNLDTHLRRNKYPGRGLVIGRSVPQNWRIIYWIMGRSESSRNRRFVIKGKTLRTEAVNPALLTDPSLIIYEAMLELPGVYLVSNGDQTRTLYEALQTGETFEAALETREREPDAPNFTARISAMLDFRGTIPALALSILKANPIDSALTDRTTFRPALPPEGFGLGLTTYRGDGNPLPSFQGSPLLLPCSGDVHEVVDRYWNALDSENRVALAVKEIVNGDSQIFVRNRY